MIIEWLGATKFRLTFNSKHGIILLQRSKAEHTVAQHFRDSSDGIYRFQFNRPSAGSLQN